MQPHPKSGRACSPTLLFWGVRYNLSVVRPISKPVHVSTSQKKYSGNDVLLEAYRRMDKEFEAMGFPPTHPARVKLRTMVEKGITGDQSGLGELGRIITTAALKNRRR